MLNGIERRQTILIMVGFSWTVRTEASVEKEDGHLPGQQQTGSSYQVSEMGSAVYSLENPWVTFVVWESLKNIPYTHRHAHIHK